MIIDNDCGAFGDELKCLLRPSCPLSRGLSAKLTGGPQGSAAGGGVKRPQRLGRHLPWHEQSEVGRLSANPDCCDNHIVSSVEAVMSLYNPQSAYADSPLERGHEDAKQQI